ncbi:hypothetical protein Csa_001504 [Cucumis sativus]|uniref:Uncharacterized protein n=1 Tax=Cucumis sativus TaxID=3659 RepID=A0A0A0LE90_CUCSA|nr:hypothetical protein Csa_001504 [Cucumis sativus]
MICRQGQHVGNTLMPMLGQSVNNICLRPSSQRVVTLQQVGVFPTQEGIDEGEELSSTLG